MSLHYNSGWVATSPLSSGVSTMKSVRFSRIAGGVIAVAALLLVSSVADSQVIYASRPAPVYQYPQNWVQRPRYYVARPATRYYANPGMNSANLIRFRGGYVDGRNPYWPTGRNIPM